MSALEFCELRDDYLGPLTLTLDEGLTLVLSPTAAPLERLVELATGVRKPRRGALRSDGALLCSSPASRRRVGALLAEETALPGATVAESLSAALSLRGSRRAPESLLADVGLTALSRRANSTLQANERRAVAFALAIAEADARLVVLHDPLALAPLVPATLVLRLCHELALRACVFVTSTRWEDAFLLGGRVLLLQRGQLNDAPMPAAALDSELLVRSSDATLLATSLASEPLLHSVQLDPSLGPDHLKLRGADLEALVELVSRTAIAHGITLHALSPRIAQHAGLAPAPEAAPTGLARAIFGRARASLR